jgi:diguanylate cyclase (GGDEF)-like protein
MYVSGRLVWRSIAGRLSVALGLALFGLVATNAHTILYAGLVAKSSKSVATISIDDVRGADDFDEALDDHRRVVTTAIDSHATRSSDAVVAKLVELERTLAENPGLPDLSRSSANIAAVVQQGIEDLKTLSRQALTLAATSSDSTAVSTAEEAYVARVSAMEPVVTDWKKQMREVTAAELHAMNQQAVFMQRLGLILLAGGCIIGTAAVLISHGMLRRLKQLTRAMLSLAGGDLATNVPYCGVPDEIGHLADALEVFRDNAKRVLASETKLNIAFENMVEAILMFSPDRTVVLHNQKTVAMLGLPCRDCRGMTGPDMFEHLRTQQAWPDEVTKEIQERFAGMLNRDSTDVVDIALPDGRSFTITATVLPDRHLLISMEDTSDRRASAARIAHLAHYDMLTELPNRAMFQERLSAAVEDALCESGIGVALLVCDLDRFKEVNDTYGHPAGDELLAQVAQRMRETMRKTDVLARLGGDEFAIVHLIGGDPEEAHAVAERIVSVLSQPFEIQGNKVCIGASVGIARAPVDATTLTDLMKRADLALYAAKQSGRNRFVVYDASMAEKMEERRVIAMEMRKALDADGFHLFYRPQVDLRTRQILGFEALARWTHPVRGAIGPATFIPIAEESGLIVQLGDWALRTACHEAASWDGDTRIAVNVSPQQLHEEGFVNTVRLVLRETGLAPERLELEVTETAMLNDGEKMLAVLEGLRALGVHLALDDFGTGYSALSYLQKFPFDKIKIDQSFVRQLGDKEESDAIVRAVAGLGTNLGIPTIAEGIETEDQAQRVLGVACDEGQGYLYSRPVPASVVRELLAKQPLQAELTSAFGIVAVKRN